MTNKIDMSFVKRSVGTETIFYTLNLKGLVQPGFKAFRGTGLKGTGFRGTAF